MTWVEDIQRAVDETLVIEGDDIALQIENMDSKRYHTSAYFESLARHYAEKYRDTQFDLILATDNNAYDFLLQRKDELFPGVPMVFSGVNDFNDTQISDVAKITGVAEQFDAGGTIEFALKTFPKTRQIYIINDYLKTGRAWVRELERQLSEIDPTVELIYSENLSLAEQKKRIAGLPETALVLLGVYYSDRDGYQSTYEKIGAELVAESQVPVFCLLEFNVGQHVIGGNVISGYYQGQMMAALGKKILQGEPVESLAVVSQGANQFIFDFNALTKWGIGLSELPEEAIVINEPWTFYNAYRSQIWLAVVFVLLLLAIILTLYFSIRKRIKIESELRDSKQRFESIFNQTFQFIGLLTPEGVVLDANQTALKRSNIDLGEIKDRHFADAPWFSHSPQEQAKLREAIRTAASGEFVRLQMTHQIEPGRLIDVDFSLKPVFDAKGEVTLLIPEGRDISELKEAQSALEQSSNLLKRLVADQQFLLNNINDFIYRHDLTGKFEYVSPSIKQITGYTVEEWGGHYADYLTASPLNERVKKYTDEALRTGVQHVPYEIEITHKNGNLLRLEISERPYKKADEIVGMIGVARDVTDRAKAEEVVQDLNSFQQTILENADVWLAVYDV
ncbi:MAG: PAS domain S-box protein, partial [Sedimenticola sp.]|nr:PAS domain S-box protein [Sedimenticola sp.]